MAQLLYAKYYAVNALDAELFRRLAAEIEAGDAASPAEARLANAVAKRKSRRLLEKIDDLF